MRLWLRLLYFRLDVAFEISINNAMVDHFLNWKSLNWNTLWANGSVLQICIEH